MLAMSMVEKEGQKLAARFDDRRGFSIQRDGQEDNNSTQENKKERPF